MRRTKADKIFEDVLKGIALGIFIFLLLGLMFFGPY